MCLEREWILFDDDVNDDDDQTGGENLARLFLCYYPTPAPPLKGAGSCDDHSDNDDEDGG